MVAPSISQRVCGSIEIEGALPAIALRRSSVATRVSAPFPVPPAQTCLKTFTCLPCVSKDNSIVSKPYILNSSYMHGIFVNLVFHLDTCNSVGPSVGPTMPTSPVLTSHSCADVRGLATTQAPQARAGTCFSEKPYCSTCRPMWPCPTWHCSET
ncbi:hypothetical protein VNO80_15942 [Phaseolus coccineus]|uniref:Uncharacterized protein n=1 Tax=Phaseolus coccineus TaxID=3886 RepID=A0AAN9MLJ0_PHACN